MTLIKSISGIRGTIGGRAGDALTPMDIAKFTAAYATFIDRTTTLPDGSQRTVHAGEYCRVRITDSSSATLKGTVIG